MTDGKTPAKMNRFHRILPGLALAIVALFLLIAAKPHKAGAYVLEGPHILDLTAKELGRLANLQVMQKLTLHPSSVDSEAVTLDETAIYVMPERFRSDINTDRFHRTHLVFGNRSLTVVDSRTVSEESPFDLYQRLIRSRTRSRLMRTLHQLGVETAISSLGRVEEALVYVIGAYYPDETACQLAVDKETFLPVRLLLTDQLTDGVPRRMEIFFRNWQKIKKGWFPFQVDYFNDGQVVREIRTVDIQINPTIPSEWMDLEALRASVAQDKELTPQEEKREAVEEVQQAVENFQKKFE